MLQSLSPSSFGAMSHPSQVFVPMETSGRQTSSRRRGQALLRGRHRPDPGGDRLGGRPLPSVPGRSRLSPLSNPCADAADTHERRTTGQPRLRDSPGTSQRPACTPSHRGGSGRTVASGGRPTPDEVTRCLQLLLGRRGLVGASRALWTDQEPSLRHLALARELHDKWADG
jgi:hypothetical protein